MLADRFSNWHHIGGQHSQPEINGHSKNYLLANIDFNMGFT